MAFPIKQRQTPVFRHCHLLSNDCWPPETTRLPLTSMAAVRTTRPWWFHRRYMEQLESSIEVNQAALSAAIDALVEGLARHRDTRLAITELPGVPALDALQAMFGLSSFERSIVLLCAGVELDTRIGAFCSEATGRLESAYPTFAYALSALPQPHWSALGPDSPLRRWRMIDLALSPELPLSTRPL